MRVIFWLAVFLGASGLARAEDTPTKVWVTPGSYTHHFKSGDYREDNYGLGAEVVLAPQHGVLAGNFINSNRERSRYAGYHWRPWEWKPIGVSVRTGFVLALIDGYTKINGGKWFPAAFPSLGAEYGIYGANLTLIPNPRNGSAVALQLKMQVW